MTTYTTSELRTSLAKIRRQVQIKKQRIQITHYAQPAFWLMPASEFEFEDGCPSVTLSDFRDQLTMLWEELEEDGGCILVTFHDRPSMVVTLVGEGE